MQIYTRGHGIAPTQAIEARIERRLLFALGRFTDRLEDVSVVFRDLNGSRGGIDAACHMVARLRPGGAVRVEETCGDLYSAIDRAADRLGHAVSREVGRRRRHRRESLGRSGWGWRAA